MDLHVAPVVGGCGVDVGRLRTAAAGRCRGSSARIRTFVPVLVSAGTEGQSEGSQRGDARPRRVARHGSSSTFGGGERGGNGTGLLLVVRGPCVGLGGVLVPPRHPVNPPADGCGSPCRWVHGQGTLRGYEAPRHRPSLEVVDNREDVREFLTTRRARITPEQVAVPDHRQPPREGAAPQRGRDAGRPERGVLRPARAGPDRRRLVQRPGGAGAGAAARRDRASAPVRPRPCRGRHPHQQPSSSSYAGEGRVPTQPAVGARGHHRRCRLRPRPAPEPAGDQHPRPGVLLARHRRRRAGSRSYAEPRPLPVPRPRLAGLLPRLGPLRRDVRGHHAHRGGPRPARPRPAGPRRRLSTRARPAWSLWAAHHVHTHGTGTKRFQHPVVGELTLAYEELAITAERGLVLLVCTAEPGSPSAERLRLLASWAASEQATVPSPHPQEESSTP